MTPEDFVHELDAAVQATLARVGAASAVGEPGPGVGIPELLSIALRNELEASEEAARWMTTEPDVVVKLSLARQCGDEAKHYRLIEARLRALGGSPPGDGPLPGGFGPMYSHLAALETTVERVAAGPFAREALACVRNEVFAAYCDDRGDRETAALYRDTILPDERHHHALGRALLLRYAVTDAQQEAARRAASRTLELAEELQEIARLKKGISCAPGC